ncbi:MAG TPA: ATP-binding cassette domain-containing protein [Candidatus Dormibacteraeota bacterium]
MLQRAGRLAGGHWRVLVAAAVGAATLLAIGPLGLTDRYQNFVITTVAVFAIITLSVSELAGLSGIWSVGHMAFVAIGAYATAYFSSRGLALPLIALLAMGAAAAVGFGIGLTAGRFEVLYLAILTLALALVGGEVIGRWDSVTGGDQGTPVTPFRIFGQLLRLDSIATVAVATATVVFVLVDLAARGRWGRRWLAIKNQRLAAISIGLNPTIENATAFGASAALAALAGVLLALQIGYISPDTFSLTNAINFVVAAVVGGVGSIAGAVLGTAFIVVVPEAARGAQDLQVIVFGVVTIAILLFLPEGIAPGLVRRAAPLLGLRRRGTAPRGGPAGNGRDQPPGDLELPPVSRPSELTVESVTVSFGGLKALEDVRLSIGPGQVVALIGPNGAGKTTFLNVLGGFVRPQKGARARFGDTDLLRQGAQRRARSGMARTFQHAELFSELPVLDTVVLAARARHRGSAAREAARTTLEALRLTDHAGSLPGALPFGIQKRVDIARALATGPSLIVMDEPFSGLDLAEQQQLNQLIRAFRKAGVSVLLVDHAVQQVLSLADRVFVLDYGRIIAEGTPEEIRRSDAVKEAYFGSVAVTA